MSRRIPWWAVVLAFAVAMGSAVGGLAYLRRPQRVSFCDRRTPAPALVKPLVEHGSRRAKDACQLEYRARRADDAPVQLVVISARSTMTQRLMDMSLPERVHPVHFDRPHARGVYVQLDTELRLVMTISAAEVIEIRLTHDALPTDRIFEMAEDIGARLQ